MGKYLKLFEQLSDYKSFNGGDNWLTPNASLIVNDNAVKYSGYNINIKTGNYFRFTAVEPSNIILNQVTIDSVSTPDTVNLEYSFDEKIWENWDFNNPIQLEIGQTVHLKGYNENGFSNINLENFEGYYLTFAYTTGKVECSGNIMSLIYGDNYTDKLDIPNDTCFMSLFSDFISIMNGNVVNFDYLLTAPELPATTLTDACYYGMFYGCTSLVTAPSILPATTLSDNCYSGIFDGCTSLITAPELPATTLTDSCYEYMFYGCTNLNEITILATDISANACLTNWVDGVASTGIFYKHSDMFSLPSGVSGIPSGWEVKDCVN